MSYEPTNWKTGDVVTSAKLNKIEGGASEVNEAYDPTVWKTGDVVTSAKLNKIEQALADATAESWVTVFDDSITTEYNEHFNANEAYITTTEPLTADTIKATFDGTEYECQNISPHAGFYLYGGYNVTTEDIDFSEYPFCIAADEVARVMTEQEGTYSLKIEVPESSGGSSDVSTAVVAIKNNLSYQVQANVPYLNDSNMFTFRNILSANSRNELIVPIGANGAICELVKFNDGSYIPMEQVSVSGEIDKVEHTIEIMGSGMITINKQSN